MKKTATVLGAAAAAAMIAAPVAAAERYSAPVDGESEIGLGGSGAIIGVIAAAAVCAGQAWGSIINGETCSWVIVAD